jgi:hypothetical protein
MFKYATPEQLEKLAELKLRLETALIKISKRDAADLVFSEYAEALQLNNFCAISNNGGQYDKDFFDPDLYQHFKNKVVQNRTSKDVNRFFIATWTPLPLRSQFPEGPNGANDWEACKNLWTSQRSLQYSTLKTGKAGPAAMLQALLNSKKEIRAELTKTIADTRTEYQDFEKFLLQQDKEMSLASAQTAQLQSAQEFAETLTNTFNSPTKIISLFVGIGLLAVILILSISKIAK